MIIEEFFEYMSKWTSIEELILAGIGLVFLIIIFYFGEKEQKQGKMESENRKVDELGRVVIPFDIRQELGIVEKNNLTLFADGNRLILKKGIEVDQLGRITIPLHIRKSMGIEEKDELEFEVVEDTIIINKKGENAR